jgi:hypothetical protein
MKKWIGKIEKCTFWPGKIPQATGDVLNGMVIGCGF